MPEEKKWYEMDEEERIKKIYGQFTIKQFFDWWSGGENKYMEVRIKDFNLIKEVAKKYNIPWSASGVYVHNADLLKKVIGYTRDKAVMWFGINPRRKNFGNYSDRKVFGGGDNFIESMRFLFIDIDRVKKETFATAEELKACDDLAGNIIEKLEVVGWNKSYIKICSGNGCQLLFTLWPAVVLPECEYNWKDRVYKFNEEFDKIKRTLRKGIGVEIKMFADHYKNKLGCEIDPTGFKISGVAALPFTKNFKYGAFRWRGIIEMYDDGKNDGLIDYILSKKVVEDGGFSTFIKSSGIRLEMQLRKGKIKENAFTKLLMEQRLPAGGRNNILWFQYQCLARDSGIDVHSDEFKEAHHLIEKIQKNTFPLSNLPKSAEFNPDTINKYCLDNMIVPIYPLWEKRMNDKRFNIGEITYDMIYLVDEGDTIELEGESYLQDFVQAKKLLDGKNKRLIFAGFLRGFIKKYGEDKTKFFIKNKIFQDFFGGKDGNSN